MFFFIRITILNPCVLYAVSKEMQLRFCGASRFSKVQRYHFGMPIPVDLHANYSYYL